MFLLQSKPGLEGWQRGVARPRERGGVLEEKSGHAIPSGDQAKMLVSTEGNSTHVRPDGHGVWGLHTRSTVP